MKNKHLYASSCRHLCTAWYFLTGGKYFPLSSGWFYFTTLGHLARLFLLKRTGMILRSLGSTLFLLWSLTPQQLRIPRGRTVCVELVFLNIRNSLIVIISVGSSSSFVSRSFADLSCVDSVCLSSNNLNWISFLDVLQFSFLAFKNKMGMFFHLPLHLVCHPGWESS